MRGWLNLILNLVITILALTIIRFAEFNGWEFVLMALSCVWIGRITAHASLFQDTQTGR